MEETRRDPKGRKLRTGESLREREQIVHDEAPDDED